MAVANVGAVDVEIKDPIFPLAPIFMRKLTRSKKSRKSSPEHEKVPRGNFPAQSRNRREQSELVSFLHLGGRIMSFWHARIENYENPTIFLKFFGCFSKTVSKIY